MRKQNIIKIFFFFFFSTTQICVGQVPSASFYFDHLTINNGLTHNTVNCILQDQHGYIWIGTQNGLNKYDGYSFEVNRSNTLVEDGTGFIGKQISSLFEDKNGNLWVGTKKRGINFKSKSSDYFINLESDSVFVDIRGFEISSFFEDEEENIWITTIGAGILRFNPNTQAFQIFNKKNSNISSDVTFDIVKDKFGLIWVATAGGGLNNLVSDSRFEMSHQMLPNSPNMSGYRKKLLLDDDYLWIGTQGTGLYKMNLKDKSFIHFQKDSKVRPINSNAVMDLFKTQDGRLLILTDGGGLNIYNLNSEEIIFYAYQADEQTSLNSNALQCLWEDKTGNIWIGTFNGGVNIHKPNKTWFDFYSPANTLGNGLLGQSILSIIQIQNGDILYGTDGGGLHWLNKGESSEASTFIHDPMDANSISGNVVKTIFEDSQGQIWAGLFAGGLELFDPVKKTFDHLMWRRPNVWSISETKNGKLLIATLGDGLHVADIYTKNISRFQSKLIPDNNAIDLNLSSVFVDKSDRIWIGSLDNGLILIDEPNSSYRHFKHNPLDSFSISNNEVISILQDSTGEIWIGTEGGGLNRWLENGRFEWFDETDGLISNSVMGIMEDETGLLWISTFQGVSQLDKSSKDISNFDFRTFQNTNQFNQNAILKDRVGKIYFGGINGLHSILPGDVKDVNLHCDLIFTDFKIFGVSIPVGKLDDGRIILEKSIEDCDDINLSYKDKSFTIFFTAIDYTNPLENEFSFKLEGFSQDWDHTSIGKPSATYTNLDPGTYVFKIRHRGQAASINIHIKPPFWRTVWFRLMVLMLTLTIIFSGLYFWIKRREAAANRKIMQLQNEKLETEVEAKNSKLMFSSVQMAHKNEILSELKESLMTFEQKPKDNFRSLIRKLDYELENEDYWKEFNMYFNEVDQKFLDRMIKMHPMLTTNDLRICSLLRMNLSTKEIASLLNISIRTVEQNKYRLKKRLKLDKNQDLLKYISSIP